MSNSGRPTIFNKSTSSEFSGDTFSRKTRYMRPAAAIYTMVGPS